MAVNQNAITPCVSNQNHYPSQSGNYPHTQHDYQNNQLAQFSQSFGNTHNQNFPVAPSQGYTHVQQQQKYYDQNFGNVTKINCGCWLSLLFLYSTTNY